MTPQEKLAALEGGIKLRKLSDGEWIVRIGDGQIPELFDTPQSALAAALDCLGIATPEQPGSAVQGEAFSVYAALRSIRYNATHGSQDRPIHVRLSLIADEANKAIAAIEATTPPPAPAAEQAQPEARGVEAYIEKLEHRVRGFRSSEYGKGKQDGIRECIEDARALLATPNPVRAEQPEGKGDDPGRMAIRLLVAAGHVTEAMANEALCIAHGFEPGPLAPAAPVGVDE